MYTNIYIYIIYTHIYIYIYIYMHITLTYTTNIFQFRPVLKKNYLQKIIYACIHMHMYICL